ncbi:MAG: hypothetical protein H6734_09805 [Alphaproteobacteria bacterium]|nr:hypothetical protein [Alphaproteobacteria bacterium]
MRLVFQEVWMLWMAAALAGRHEMTAEAEAETRERVDELRESVRPTETRLVFVAPAEKEDKVLKQVQMRVMGYTRVVPWTQAGGLLPALSTGAPKTLAPPALLPALEELASADGGSRVLFVVPAQKPRESTLWQYVEGDLVRVE